MKEEKESELHLKVRVNVRKHVCCREHVFFKASSPFGGLTEGAKAAPVSAARAGGAACLLCLVQLVKLVSEFRLHSASTATHAHHVD